MKRLALLLLCLLPLPGLAQKVMLPAEVKGRVGAFVSVPADTDCAELQWLPLDSGLELFPVALLRDSRTAVVTSAKPGRYRLLAYGAKGDRASPPAVVVVVIGDVPPGPGPGPDPTPPDPPPVPTKNLRVLIVYESGDLSKMPAAQQSVLYSKAVRDLLDAKTVLGPDGKTHEWRIWDKDVDASAAPKFWQDALKRPRSTVPWIHLIGDAGPVYEGPLPANVDATLELLRKWGAQ